LQLKIPAKYGDTGGGLWGRSEIPSCCSEVNILCATKIMGAATDALCNTVHTRRYLLYAEIIFTNFAKNVKDIKVMYNTTVYSAMFLGCYWAKSIYF
jgi:hypothetical protein